MSVAACPVCYVSAGHQRPLAGKRLNSCPSCGLEWFDPSVYSPDHANQYLSDRTSPTAYYRLSAECDRDAFDDRMRRLIELTGRESGRVLDIGCSVGTFLGVAVNHGWQAVGVEPNPAAAAIARARGLNVHVGFFDRHLASQLGEFDAVHLSEVIEHVFDPVEVLQTAARTLVPGGVLLVTTPDFDSMSARALQRKPDEHVVHFRRRSLMKAAARAGFEVTGIERLLRRRSIAAMQHSTTFGAPGRALMRVLARAGITRAVEWCLRPCFRDGLLLTARRPTVRLKADATTVRLKADTTYSAGTAHVVSGFSRTSLLAKRALDIAGSSLGLLVLSPLLLMVAAAIRLQDGRPALYRGRRIGLHGRPFVMFKFRTMCADAHVRGGTSTPVDDARITPVGRLLRRYKLDELPQLLNVLTGDMSLVGPRPQVEWAIKLYTPEEQALLSVRPGMTDYASIRFANESEILRGSADPDRDYLQKIAPEKIRLGLEYVRTQSVLLDVRIILATLWAIVGGDPKTMLRRQRGLRPDAALHISEPQSS